MPADSPSKRRSAVATRARRARKMAKDGVPRQRIAADLGVGLRAVDRYLAQGRAAAPKPREMRVATAHDLARMAEPGKPKHRYKNVGTINRASLRRLNGFGDAAHPAGRPFQRPMLARDAFKSDPTDPAEIERRERCRIEAESRLALKAAAR